MVLVREFLKEFQTGFAGAVAPCAEGHAGIVDENDVVRFGRICFPGRHDDKVLPHSADVEIFFPLLRPVFFFDRSGLQGKIRGQELGESKKFRFGLACFIFAFQKKTEDGLFRIREFFHGKIGFGIVPKFGKLVADDWVGCQPNFDELFHIRACGSRGWSSLRLPSRWGLPRRSGRRARCRRNAGGARSRPPARI